MCVCVCVFSRYAAVDYKFVAYKHVANGVFPNFAYPLASQIIHVPIAVGETMLFCGILYFMSGMTNDVGRFFFFCLCGFLINVFMGTLLRLFAFASETLQVRDTVMSVVSCARVYCKACEAIGVGRDCLLGSCVD